MVVPLFSIYSKESAGIGEIPDIKLLIDWAEGTGNSIIQLLPLQDSGFNFSPYSSQSYFALDPVYLSLAKIKKIDVGPIEVGLKKLRRKFFKSGEYVDYKIKTEKLGLLRRLFSKNLDAIKEIREFEKFKEKNRFWLEDYSLFRCLKQSQKERAWWKWKEPFRGRGEKELEKFRKRHFLQIEFQKWLQWQLFEQLRDVRRYAKRRGVLLAGDLPWLIAKDSVDVWRYPEYFELDFSAGAPPDQFSRRGQRWGMPPLNWQKIFEDNFVYFKRRLEYNETFYDLFRIDHAVGLFRIWKIPERFPKRLKGLRGFFDPLENSLSEKQGRKILLAMAKSAKMLAYAEDLGAVPPSCPRVLQELGIPGMRVQRWANDYPFLSIATLSTPDTSNWPAYFKRTRLKYPSKEQIENNLKTINETNSVFSIILLLEWLFLGNVLKSRPEKYRFNFPGTNLKRNWSLKMPLSLEELLDLSLNAKIREILEKTGRVA